MASFSDFKDSLGKPYEGFHSNRLNIFGLNLAYNDFIGSIIISCVFAIIVGLILFYNMKLYKLSLINIIIYWIFILVYFIFVTFLFGIILHRLFRVNTELNKHIFGEL